jgi:predicted nucleotide-binding protein
MPLQFPTDPKEQYEFLVEQAERYIRRRKVAATSLRQWRNRALDWLKNNAPNSDLSDALVIVPAGSLQRGLGVFLRARPVVPFLRDTPTAAVPKPKNTNKVFIVHGRDDALKNSVARFLTRLGLEPVILHEQPNKGRTIIEKFIDHSDVGFAVVLLTPDDRGGITNSSPDSYRGRARQNVIMELGFFLGRLGRERVAAIYDNDVEMPSDYSGVLFLPYDDAGVWQFPLAKEIRAAGLRVDLNRL